MEMAKNEREKPKKEKLKDLSLKKSFIAITLCSNRVFFFLPFCRGGIIKWTEYSDSYILQLRLSDTNIDLFS